MFEELLPRHLEIIYEINHRFLAEVARALPGDDDLPARVSLIDESRRAPRAHGARWRSWPRTRSTACRRCIRELMVETIFADFARLYPDRFHNVTNGVTPRRWLMQANPALSALIDARIGNGWRRDLDRLADAGAAWPRDAGVRRAVPGRPSATTSGAWRALIRRELGIVGRPGQPVRRAGQAHPRIQAPAAQPAARRRALPGDRRPTRAATVVPRTVILAGKAASAYQSAKLIIQLAHDIARVVNSDPRVAGRLKLVFLPNYGVSAGRGDHPRRRPERADLAPPAPKPRAPAT